MAILFVGPNSLYPTIAQAMAAAVANDTVQLEAGYSNETATVTQGGMTVQGDASSTGIVLQLGVGVAVFTAAGTAPIEIRDAVDANGIVGNAGNNLITVSAGVDAVDGGLGIDRLVVDYRLATGAVTGDSTSNFTEAGGGGRTATVTDGTIEHFTVLTGAGADTITTGSGDDIIAAGDGANTVTAGQGANTITGGNDADTITALDGGNVIDGGNGTNMLTSGAGNDIILSGTGADTIVAGAGADVITVRGGADSVDAGAGPDRLIVDYSAMTTNVTGGITGGNLAGGYVGHIADLVASTVDFQGVETFTITTGSGNDTITSGDGDDVVASGAGNDTLTGGAGNDTLNGGEGVDTFVFLQARDQYQIGILDNIVRVHGPDGNDELRNAEMLKFGGSAAITVDSLRGQPTTDELYQNLDAGTLKFGMPTRYIGPNALDYILPATNGDDVLQGTSRNDFVNLGAGNDAASMGAGDDVVDGGGGSNFLTGGLGRDTFFVDGRDLVPAWSCITDWEPGEMFTLWGWRDGVSVAAWSDSDGLPGYMGATMYADLDGNGLVETAMTWAGVARADLPAPSAFEVSGIGVLYIG